MRSSLQVQLLMLYPIPPPAGFAFHVVEVMSSPRFHLKRELYHVRIGLTILELGYLAAPMAFSGDTEEVVLTVNGIKKVSFTVKLLLADRSGLDVTSYPITPTPTHCPTPPTRLLAITLAQPAFGPITPIDTLLATYTKTSGPMSTTLLGSFPRRTTRRVPSTTGQAAG